MCYRKKLEHPLIVYKDAKLRDRVPDPGFLCAVRVVYIFNDTCLKRTKITLDCSIKRNVLPNPRFILWKKQILIRKTEKVEIGPYKIFCGKLGNASPPSEYIKYKVINKCAKILLTTYHLRSDKSWEKNKILNHSRQ